VNGYAVIEAINASYLYWEWINSADDRVYDRMALVQTKIINDVDDDDAVAVASSTHHGLSGNELAGIIVGVVTLILCLLMCLYVHKLFSSRPVPSLSFSTVSVHQPPTIHTSYAATNTLSFIQRDTSSSIRPQTSAHLVRSPLQSEFSTRADNDAL
jgi:hypothetical protein